jgi:hypothetical protein
VIVALVLGALAWWCWHHGIVPTTMRRGVALIRIEGRWWAAAVGATTLAAILLLDAGRRIMVPASRRQYS